MVEMDVFILPISAVFAATSSSMVSILLSISFKASSTDSPAAVPIANKSPTMDICVALCLLVPPSICGPKSISPILIHSVVLTLYTYCDCLSSPSSSTTTA